MKQRLNDVFIRAVITKVEDCSNPIQLRGYLNKYKNYVFSPKIFNVFKERIEFFKEQFAGNTLAMNACEDLEDILEFEVEISKVLAVLIKSENNHSKTVRAMIADPGNDVEPVIVLSIKELKNLIVKSKGCVKTMANQKNLSPEIIHGFIKQYKLGSFLRHYKR